MHVIVEMWSPTRKFFEASESERRDFFSALQQALGAEGSPDLTSLGWGAVDQTVDRTAAGQWFAVWQAPDAETVTTFLGSVLASEWYEWFDQVNLTVELEDATAVIGRLAALPTQSVA